MRRLALLGVPLALAACGSSKKAAPTTTTTPAATTAAPSVPTLPSDTGTGPTLHPATGAVAVSIKAPNHRPKVNAPWRYTVRVTSKGKPVAARIYLDILFKGTPVGNVGTHLVSRGVWAETIRWPAASRGQPLVFEARAVSSGRVATARYPIRVQ